MPPRLSVCIASESVYPIGRNAHLKRDLYSTPAPATPRGPFETPFVYPRSVCIDPNLCHPRHLPGTRRYGTFAIIWAILNRYIPAKFLPPVRTWLSTLTDFCKVRLTSLSPPRNCPAFLMASPVVTVAISASSVLEFLYRFRCSDRISRCVL